MRTLRSAGLVALVLTASSCHFFKTEERAVVQKGYRGTAMEINYVNRDVQAATDKFAKPARFERGDRPERGERPERPAFPKKQREARTPDEGKSTFRIEVGYDHGVKPGNIVGAIANEAGLDAKHIGRIEIFEDHTLLDLPDGMPPEIMQHLKGVWCAGQQLRITRDGEPPDTAGKTAGKKPFASASPTVFATIRAASRAGFERTRGGDGGGRIASIGKRWAVRDRTSSVI